jgi:D-3-phosphoglycerate dehydrogenase / 2-oxoglutarate reductase
VSLGRQARTGGRGPVVITDSDLGPADIERELCAAAGFEFSEEHCHDEQDVLEVVKHADPCGLLVQYAPITRAVIEASSNLRVVVRYGVGVDSVDLDAAADLGVMVLNVPDYSIAEVADHAVAMVLMLTRGLHEWLPATRAGHWPSPASEHALSTLETKTFGIVGFGRIGRAVARRAHAFGGSIVAFDPLVEIDELAEGEVTAVSWDELWERANIVSLHLPLTAQTAGLIDGITVAKMRPGTVLVNTSRAGVVDRAALEHGLRSNQIAAFATDVWWQEPPDANDPLIRDPRVVVSPHVAYLSTESLPRLRRSAATRLLEALRQDAAS